jgi:hypothetical protein
MFIAKIPFSSIALQNSSWVFRYLGNATAGDTLRWKRKISPQSPPAGDGLPSSANKTRNRKDGGGGARQRSAPRPPPCIGMADFHPPAAMAAMTGLPKSPIARQNKPNPASSPDIAVSLCAGTAPRFGMAKR